jgi:hypothetical protein
MRGCCSSALTLTACDLEVVGVELADGRLRVIHAMVMHPAYEELYEEARKYCP